MRNSAARDRPWFAASHASQPAASSTSTIGFSCLRGISSSFRRTSSARAAPRRARPGICGNGNLWVTELVIVYDDRPYYTVSVMEPTDGKVTHETQYFSD